VEGIYGYGGERLAGRVEIERAKAGLHPLTIEASTLAMTRLRFTGQDDIGGTKYDPWLLRIRDVRVINRSTSERLSIDAKLILPIQGQPDRIISQDWQARHLVETPEPDLVLPLAVEPQ
jgi:hypothetical protein